MTAYYNEIDPYAAQWLRNLIHAGHIAPGIVDERSIEDVFPSDLRGFTQCHFFAGIGVWSYALRAAGWPDDRPVWTGSCPCQPFSAAGAGAGFDDERHLWPAFHHLIAQCAPPVVAGEQVASKDADPWIDLVQDDLEALDYAVAALAFPSSGVGAPHIRDRVYWLAHLPVSGRGKERAHPGGVSAGDRAEGIAAGSVHGGSAGQLGNAGNARLAQRVGFPGISGPPVGADQGQAVERAGVHVGELADADRPERSPRDVLTCGPGEGCEGRVDSLLDGGDSGRPGPVNGHWRASDWLLCRDGRWRPVEPATFPLAHGAPARVGRLRAYGNAINAEAARVFIECVKEIL